MKLIVAPRLTYRPIHVPNAIYRKKPKPAAPAPPADTEGVVDNKEAEAKAERKMQFQEPDRVSSYSTDRIWTNVHERTLTG